MGNPVGMGMAGEAPSSTPGTELVTTPGVERRVKYGNQAMFLRVKDKWCINLYPAALASLTHLNSEVTRGCKE